VVVAPPAPPKPAIRQGASCSKRESPSFPREAIRAHIEKGRVTAILTIDEKGNVSEVRIVSSDPPRIFDRVVRDTLAEWKCVAEGARYQASVEINFTLKDE
jgi:periplasmic protein TonB